MDASEQILHVHRSGRIGLNRARIWLCDEDRHLKERPKGKSGGTFGISDFGREQWGLPYQENAEEPGFLCHLERTGAKLHSCVL